MSSATNKRFIISPHKKDINLSIYKFKMKYAGYFNFVTEIK